MEESRPLLGTEVLPDAAPSKGFQIKVVSICVLFLFVVEVGADILNAPLQQVLEDIICRRQYPDHQLASRAVDNRCKGSAVQEELAMLRGWDVAAQMLIPLIVQLPYGVMADKYGRRPILFLAVFGVVLQVGAIFVILSYPETFSPWSMIYTRILGLIGGGANMAIAMLFTVISDTVPVEQRTAVFFAMYAVTLLILVVVNPISAHLMSIDPWIALWLSYGILIFSAVVSLFVPETISLSRALAKRGGSLNENLEHSDLTDGEQDEAEQAGEGWLIAARRDTKRILRFIFASRGIVILLTAYGASIFVQYNILINLLQYMTKRFSWDWPTATYVSTIKSCASAILLLILLPIASSILTKFYNYSPLRRDLLLSRLIIVPAAIGLTITAIAARPQLFVTGLAISSTVDGFVPLVRALLNAVVEPHTIATLNTAVCLVETLDKTEDENLLDDHRW
ncbi:hypothetical protein PWT90_08643 [Aphanocladium album]|nr:hypothetical protein PWT90_08643 [Aphanocladium album]